MNEQQDDLGPGCYCPPANVGDGIKPQSECPVHAYLTTEQQGSDESGEGLREAERGLAIRALAVELREIWRDPHRNDGHDPLSLFGDVARTVAGDVLASDWLREHAEAALATARRDADELRGRLAALADDNAVWVWTAPVGPGNASYANGYENGRRSLADDLRAALANPSAAQGEGEVGK